MLKNSSLKWRLVIMIGGLALIGTFTLSQVAGYFSRQQIEQDQGALLKEVVVRMATILSQDMKAHADELSFLAGIDTIRDQNVPLEQKQRLFEQLKKSDSHYAWIGMTDSVGNILVSTSGLLVGKNVAKREWFTNGSKGLFYGDAHDAFLLAKLMPKPKWDDLPLRLVDIAVPVLDENGRQLAVICGHLSWDWAFGLRESMLANLPTEDIDLVVLNNAGKVLMGTPSLPSLKVDLSDFKVVKNITSNNTVPEVETWPDNTSYLTVAVPEITYESYPQMGWVVVARKAEHLAFAPATILSKSITALGIVFSVLFGLVLWAMLNRQLRPLEKVSQVAKRIHNEGLTTPIPQLGGNDEIAVFARSLTELVSTLQSKNAELRLTNRLFEESGQGIVITDADQQILRVNQSFCEITRYAPEDVIGKTPRILYSGKHDASFYKGMWESIYNKGSWQGEIWNKDRNGSLYPEWLSISALKDDQGKVSHYIGIFDDISESKRAEADLQASEQRFRQLADNINEVFWLVSPDWQEVIYVSPAYEKIWGLSCESLYQQPMSWLESIHPEDQIRVTDYIEAMTSDELTDVIFPEYRVIRPDNSVHWIQARGYPVRNAEGEIYRIAGIAEDITQRKKTEQALRESEARQSLVLQSLPMAFYTAHASGDYGGIWVSDQIESISGFSSEAFTKDTNLWSSRLHPDDSQRVLAEFAKLEVQEAITVEYRWQVADGTYKWIADHAVKSGDVNQIIGTWIDISQRKQTEEETLLAASVFNGTSDGILVTDSDGIIIQVNRGFTDITGYSAKEALGKSPSLLRSDRHSDDFYRDIWVQLANKGRWQGEIWNRRKDGQVHPVWQNITAVKDEEGREKQYIGIFSDITEKKLTEERIQYLAHYDVLTDLPNRLLFEERCRHALERAHRDNRLVVVMFLDLDHFKHINDSLGHPVGDELLKSVALRIMSLLREEDTVGRLGGDEFTIVLEEVRGVEDVDPVVNKLMKAFAEPFDVYGKELRITPSIGISLYPNDGKDVSTLIKNADAAMYRAKYLGRNNYQFYTEELTIRALERITLETQLSRALDQDELVLYYQPQLSLNSGVVIGAEALLRWQHPEMGLIPPDKFIPIAEESGLIIPIGEWVMRRACLDFMMWRQLGHSLNRVAVNVAAPQIQRGNIVETVQRILEETRLESHCLELEITENFIMQRTDQAIITIATLKGLGVELAIDDFGTGYSSLSYLKRLPIDKLKIDRSFIRDIPHDSDDVAITKAIIAMGSNLQLNIIAEGVETREQQEFLISEGCEEVQGFLYSPPISDEEFIKFLEKQGK
jgi:diguanylate cyclase (GGDEF)-like protein/PAS domain S-box-containing protein